MGVGTEWRNRLSKALTNPSFSYTARLKKVTPPHAVLGWWHTLVKHSRVSLSDSAGDIELVRALLKLCAVADEASVGIGLPVSSAETQPHGFLRAARYYLVMNKYLSFCNEVQTEKVRVLGKKHTPQQGLTLRSMTHHLSLCMPWEVQACWHWFGRRQNRDVVNLLLLPWPKKIEAQHFRSVPEEQAHVDSPADYRTFEYVRPESDPGEFENRLHEAIEAGRKRVSSLDALVFPELALSKAEWSVAERLAIKEGMVLVAGIFDEKDGDGMPVNCCRVQMLSLAVSESMARKALAESPDLVDRMRWYQGKHHRWSLDRKQILQYDLGSQLPSSKVCWERSQVGQRKILFATLGGWLTFTVLVCEDLARQDPITDVLRSVGPNLVIALLMDGPQLTTRWPARYASVLADDPGTSVLTLTSLGMCERSQESGKRAQMPSRVVALWKDKLHGSEEIAIPVESQGCVLSLACEVREEYSSDGRSDGKATEVPVFSGIFYI
jgi:hypothetical protein